MIPIYSKFIGSQLIRAAALLFLAVQSGASSLDLSLADDDLQPEVQIKPAANYTIEEYSINGNRYMVKITPAVGVPYYLVDDSGTGDLELRRDAGGRNLTVPRWVLLTW